MSLFRRETDQSPEQPVPEQPARPAPRQPVKKKSTSGVTTQIAAGSKVIGHVTGAADLVVDGVVKGEIQLESRVVVGSEGCVEGKIIARSVEVGGKVLGNVEGSERVEVRATGRFEGDVTAPRVLIAEGAFFKGKVEMAEETASRPAAPKPSPPAAGAGAAKPAGPRQDNRPGAGGAKPAGHRGGNKRGPAAGARTSRGDRK